MARNEIAGIKCALPSTRACQATLRHLFAHDCGEALTRGPFKNFHLFPIRLLQEMPTIDDRYYREARLLHRLGCLRRCCEGKFERALRQPCLYDGTCFGILSPKPIRRHKPAARFENPQHLAIEIYL